MHSLAQSIKKGHHPPPKERSSLADRPITGVVTSSTTTTTTTSGSVSYNVPTASGDLLPRTNPMGQPTSDRGTTTPTVNLSSFDSLLTNQPPTEPSFVNNDIEDSGKGGSVGSRGILKKGKVLPGPFVDEEELLEEPDQAAAASVDWDSSGKGSLASWDQPRGTTTAKINLQTIDSLVASNNDSTEPCLGDQPGLFEAMNRTDASKIITNLKGKGGTASQMSEKQRRDKSPRNDSPEGQTWRAMKYQQQQQQQQHPTHTKSKEAVSSPKRGVKASRAYPKSHLPGGIHIEQLENPNLLEPSGPSSQPGAFTIESTSSEKEEYKKNPKNSMSSKSQAFSKRQATSDVKSSLGVSATMPMEELEIPSPTASPTRQFSGPQFIPLKPNGSIQGRSYAIESHQGDAAPDIKESQTYEKRISGPDCSFHDDTIHSLFADDQKQKAQITFGHSVCKKTGSHPSDKNDPNSSKTAASSPGDEKPRRPGATQIIANASRELAPNIEMFQHDFGDERPAGALPATFVKEGAVPDRENGGAYTYRQRRELNSSQSSLPYDDDDESDPEEQPGAFAIEEGDQRQRTKGALTRLSSHESRMSQGSSKMSQLTSLTPSLTPLGEGRMSQGSSKMSQQASLTPSLTPLGADYLPPAIDAVVPPPAVDAVLIKGNDTSSSKRKWFIFIAIFLIVAICVGVAVPLIIGPSAPSTTMVPTIAIPTQAPTPAPTSDARLKAMVTKFSEISEKQLLEIVGTPQNEAVRWLANRDPARLEIDDPALEERYLATLFFYSSNLDHKDDSSILDYRSSESVCEWKVKMGKKDSSGIWCDVTGQIDLISLSDSELSGTIPSELFTLSSLVGIGLGFNKLRGTLPAEIGTCSSLKHIRFGNNELSGTIPTTLGNLENLEILDGQFNEFEGELPSQIGLARSLKELNFVKNKLSNSIPVEITNLTNIIFLGLAFNYNISGTIPTEIGNLVNLWSLDLSGNNLKGTIPSEISRATGMRNLNLATNELDGMIPSTIGQLPYLTSLRLENNFLIGQIPSDLSRLTTLDTLQLQRNSLTGSLENLCNSVNDTVSYIADCKFDKVDCSCCTECHR